MNTKAVTYNIDLTANPAAAKRLSAALTGLGRDGRRAGDQTSRAFDRADSTMRTFKRTLVALGIAQVLRSSAAAAGEFQQSMAEVSTLLTDTSGLDKTSRSVREIAKQFGQAPTSQAKALYQIISAGASDTAEALDTLTVANKLAIGGVTDVATAADGLTSILNAYGDSAGSATDVSDALFIAMRGGKTTIAELSRGIGQVAPLAATAEVGVDELTAAIAALTTGGIQTSIAVTQLRAIISAVLKPTSEATKLADKLGLSFNLQALRAKGLAGFLADVREKTGGNEEAMAQLFGSVESLGAVFALTGGQAETFTRLLDEQTRKAGETERAYAKLSDTGVQKYNRLKAVATDAMIEIGDRLVSNSDAVDDLTSALNDPQLISGLANLTEMLARLGAAAIKVASIWGRTVGRIGVALEARDVASRNDSELSGVSEDVLNKRLEQLAGRLKDDPEDADALTRRTRIIREIARRNRADLFSNVETRVSSSYDPASGRETTSGSAGGGGGQGGRGTGSGRRRNELTEEDRAAQKLQQAYESLNESLHRQIELFGDSSHAAALNYEIQHGALQGLDEDLQKILQEQAQWADFQNEMAAIEQVWADSAEAAKDYKDNATEAFNSMEEFGLQAARNLQTAFADFLFDPLEDGIKGMLRNFIDVIRRMAAEAAAASILESLGGSAKAAAGGGTDLWSQLLRGFSGAFGGGSAKGNAFMGGRMVPFANGGVIKGPMTFPMANGQFGLAAEQGPLNMEAIMPLRRGPGGRLGVDASGAGPARMPDVNIRQILVDDRANLADYVFSAQNERVIVQYLDRLGFGARR